MCTALKIHTKNNDIIVGRTNEFSGSFDCDLLFLPRGFKYLRFFDHPEFGYEELKYATIGNASTTMFKMRLELDRYNFIDGMNEFGLSVELHYFPVVFGWKVIKEMDMPKDSNYISGYTLPNIILGQNRNVAEVREWLKENHDRIIIMERSLPVQGFHFQVTDTTGASIVLEPENGVINLKENPSGVMTNAPQLEWHLENLANYIGLRSTDIVSNPKIMDNKGVPFVRRSMGNGIKQLPGDGQATSRYIRAHYLSQNANITNNVEDGVNTCFRLLHTSDIVAGTVAIAVPDSFMEVEEWEKLDGEGSFITDITDSIIVKDLSNRIYYYKDYKNISPRFIKLNDYVNETSEKRLRFYDDHSLKFQEVKFA